jgi:hypothetical protein
MKKLLGILVLGLLWCNVGIAEEILLTCDVNSTSLKTMVREDQKRFLGKKISLTVDTEKKIVTNNDQDSNLFIVHGIKYQEKLNQKAFPLPKNLYKETPEKFLEISKMKVATRYNVLSEDYKNLKKGTQITIKNVQDFSAEEWFNIPLKDPTALGILTSHKKKYNEIVNAPKKEEELSENAKAFQYKYSYKSEVILLDDKDNEKIYKYKGGISAGGKFKSLVVEIDNGGSFINSILGKKLKFFFMCFDL